jgi:N-acetylglucosamine malate deacetylase 1
MANILVVGPHPDDQEIGMGGTIAKLAEQGHSVLLLDVTDGSPTPRGDRASRLVEAEAALEALQPSPGKPQIRRVLIDLPNRRVKHTLTSRHAVAGMIRAHQASIVFCPEPTDAHPDHRAVTRIVEDARFDAKLTKVEMPVPPGYSSIGPPIYPKWLFHYEVSHLRRVVPPSFCVDITGFEQKKVTSVKAYRSQFGPWDATASAPGFAPGDPKSAGRLVTPDLPDKLLAMAGFWGWKIGTSFAEPFFAPEPLGLASLEALT